MSSLEYLFFDLNSYFASCEQQENKALRGRPVGVVPMMGVDTTCCLAASYEAKRFGVKTGTTVRDAKRMCPGIVFVPSRPKIYVQYHDKVLEAVESCVPIESVLSVDELVCKLTGSQREERNARALAAQIKARVQGWVGECLTSSIGLAPNRFLAKVGSDMQKPNGLTVIHKEDLPRALYGLVPQDLPGIGYNMNRRLALVGVRTMEALTALSKGQMRRIWGGVLGERFYLWLRGEDPYVPPTKTRCIGHEHVLEPELRTREGAAAVGRKLLYKAAVRLRRAGFYARRLNVHVRLIGVPAGEPASWDCALKLEQTQDTLIFLRAFEELWRELPGRGRILKVGVVLTDFILAAEHQYSLFDDPNKERLCHVMDELNDRFGKDTVGYAALKEVKHTARTGIAFGRVPKVDEFNE